MINWHEIWEKKGNLVTNNLKILDGYEDREFDPEEIAKQITSQLNIQKDEKILEVGCGAGMLAQYLNCDYVGIDYSKSLVKKHIEILKNPVIHCQANNILFKDNTFDKVFAYSIFQYFPNKKYAHQVVDEMKRIARKKIFIGDLPIKSHENEHLLFNKIELKEGVISEGFYNKDRFNVIYDFDR